MNKSPLLLDYVRKGQCPLNLFLLNVNECVSNRENKEYVEGRLS